MSGSGSWKIGVVVVVHQNYRALLPQTLDSLRRQSAGSYGVVVVVNGDCPECVAAAEAGGAVRVVQTTGMTLGAAANAGVAAIDAEYIVRVDGDDWVAPELLEIEQLYLDAHPEVDCVWCDTARSHLLSQSDAHQTYLVQPQEETELHLSCGAMFRRDCWEEIGGYADRSHGENIDFWLRFKAHGFRAERIPFAAYYYRQHRGQMHTSEEAKRARRELGTDAE